MAFGGITPPILQDSVNLPNLAAIFWSHADEERSHAIQFMQYLRMRGAENNNFFGDSPIQPKEGRFNWSSVDDVRFVYESVQCFISMYFYGADALIFYSKEILNLNIKLSFDDARLKPPFR